MGDSGYLLVYGCPLAVHVKLSRTANWLYPIQTDILKNIHRNVSSLPGPP